MHARSVPRQGHGEEDFKGAGCRFGLCASRVRSAHDGSDSWVIWGSTCALMGVPCPVGGSARGHLQVCQCMEDPLAKGWSGGRESVPAAGPGRGVCKPACWSGFGGIRFCRRPVSQGRIHRLLGVTEGMDETKVAQHAPIPGERAGVPLFFVTEDGFFVPHFRDRALAARKACYRVLIGRRGIPEDGSRFPLTSGVSIRRDGKGRMDAGQAAGCVDCAGAAGHDPGVGP